MGEDTPLYVAVFRDHPLGTGRYTKDFRRNLTGWQGRQWWSVADTEARQQHFVWALSHEQYHYSTDDLNKADFWGCNDEDAEDRAILEQYAPVDFIEVEIKHTPPGEDGWSQWYLEIKEPA
jgi:hypothetical protein